MNRRIVPLLAYASVAISVVGCARGHQVETEASPAAMSAPAEVAEPEPNVAEPAKLPDIAEAPASEASVAQFTPPFPHRLDLFEPPQRAKSTVRRDDEGETVELKGFINVDQPKVLLAIDGVIAPIPEGGEKYGVQVITIEPPSVVLQRGRNRWKATLE